MSQRTSSMGSRSRLSRFLLQEQITGTDAEIANTHEVNRQSTVKEILLHVFLMSKFNMIGPLLEVGEAKNQYFTSTGGNQAAHCSPGQILRGTTPIQRLIAGNDELELIVENLFAKTDGIPTRFNTADSRAEENGLRNALREACIHVARAAKVARFNRAFEFYRHLDTAFGVYKSRGVNAIRQAITRQRELATASDAANREQTVVILETYGRTLASAENSIETVILVNPEDVWQQYR